VVGVVGVGVVVAAAAAAVRGGEDGAHAQWAAGRRVRTREPTHLHGDGFAAAAAAGAAAG
jgi:hypothetical protein